MKNKYLLSYVASFFVVGILLTLDLWAVESPKQLKRGKCVTFKDECRTKCEQTWCTDKSCKTELYRCYVSCSESFNKCLQ